MNVGFFTMDSEGVLSPCTSAVAERAMAEEDSRVLATSAVEGGFVSTAFVPICLMFEDGSPQAFETVVVRSQKSIVAKRYSDLSEVLKGHDQIVESLK